MKLRNNTIHFKPTNTAPVHGAKQPYFCLTGAACVGSHFGSCSSDFVQGSMPKCRWTSGSGTYMFDGANVVGNPTIGVWLTTNTDIAYLTLTSDTDFASFAIAAPTPEPGSLALLGSGVLCLGGMLRRKFLG